MDRQQVIAVLESLANGMVAQIALKHGRTSRAITSRLVKLGKIEAEAAKPNDGIARAVS